jgi:predicted transcriptional regulator
MVDEEVEISNEIKKSYDEAIYDEVKYGILIALEFYKSLNLKKLAEILDRPKTTTLRYLKNLLNEGLIILDTNKTAKDWGKFYKLSQTVEFLIESRKKKTLEREKWITDEFETIDEKNDEEVKNLLVRAAISKEDFQVGLQEAKQSIFFITNVQKMIINKLIITWKDLMKIYEDKGIEHLKESLTFYPADVEMRSTTLKLYTPRQLIDLIKLFNSWNDDLVKIKERFENEMENMNIPEEQRHEFFLYSFLGSLEFGAKFKD